MATDTIRRGLPAMHPGELLREDIIPASGKSKTEIARLLGISRQTLYDIIDEKQPVTVSMALRFAKFFGTTPQFWINMQAVYDLEQAEREVDVSSIPTLRVA